MKGRMPPGATLVATWVVYAAFLAFVYPLTPLAALAMVFPLVLTGWHARRWIVAASIGLGHGLALAALGWRVGAFDAWPGGDTFALAAALVTLVSWALAIAGWTLRVMNILRLRTQDLEAARQEIQSNAATVEAVYSASAAALIGLDASGTIVSWNPSAASIIGYPAAKAIGSPIEMLAAVGHTDDSIGRIRYVVDMKREMSTFSGKMRNADGKVLDVEVHPRLVHGHAAAGVILTVVDRTREVALGDEVARHAQQQDRIIHNLDEVLYSVAVPSMHTLMMGRAVELLTGQDAEHWHDFRGMLALAHPDDEEEVKRRWERARSGEKSVLRWRLRTALGSHVWVEDRVVPARDDDGRVVRVDGSMRRIFRELELERQAQRMMRWLDSLEPMSGGGAWSIDLRSGAWQWSGGMRRILGMHDDPENGLDAWRARLAPASMQALSLLVKAPEDPQPLVLDVVGPDGQPQQFLMEPWVQRGADGEAIWLYGIVRPRGAGRRRRRTRSGTKMPPQPAGAGPQPAALLPPTPMTSAAGSAPVAVPPDSPLVGRHIGAALARARETFVAAHMGEDADVIAAIDDACATTLEQAQTWARTPRVASATRGIHSDDIPFEVKRLAEDAERRALHAVLAAHERAAAAAVTRAGSEASRLEAEARQRIAAAQADAQTQIEAARAQATAAAAKAQHADDARAEAEQAMEAALAAAQDVKVQAERDVVRARDEALAQAQAARQEAAAQAARAKQADEARAKAEAARQAALAVANEAQARAVQEADQARAQALRVAEDAKAHAEREAEKARQAEAATREAEAARQRAVQAAEEAKAKVVQEAGQARSAALKTAEEAQRRAEAEAQKARLAEHARREADEARLRAAKAADEAKARALQDADAARTEAMQAAREAQEQARREAEKAKQATEALKQAEAATAQALQAAQAAQQRAQQEQKARIDAIAQAKKATDEAMQKAEKALQAARKEAERAAVAEKVRIETEATVAQALQQAEQTAQQARQEAESMKAEALHEAERAHAAARAEAAKAQEAEKALAAALLENRKARDQAIREAERARDEAVAAAQRARGEAVQQAQHERDEALGQLAQAQERVADAEASAEQAWAEVRAQAVEIEASSSAWTADELAAVAEAAPGQARDHQGTGFAWQQPQAAGGTDPTGMDVVWDDEIGWMPRPRDGQHNDKAEQLKAKSWQGGEAETKKRAGPWALD